jgi:truncated hemoglobin YjbI
MVNKLTMNPDFKGFLERIEKDLKINETTLSWYDHVPKDEDLKAISKTKISYT